MMDAIIAEEGVSRIEYICPAGARTIGVGHNIDVHGLPEWAVPPLTDEMLQRLLEEDIRRAESDARTLIDDWDSLPQAVRDILVHMSFQLGRTRLRGFRKFLAAVARHDWAAAADEMMDSKWAREDSPARAQRLVRMMRGQT